MKHTIIDKAERFMLSHRAKLEIELKQIEDEILALQEKKARIANFLRTFVLLKEDQPEVKPIEKNKVTAMSSLAIKIARELYNKNSFTVDEFLVLALKEDPLFNKASIYGILSYWKNKSWLETLGFGKYKIKEALIIANEKNND